MERPNRVISHHRHRTCSLYGRYSTRHAQPPTEPQERRLERNPARTRAHRLEWVYRQMRLRLTARERHCLMLHYLQQMTFVEIGAATQTDPSAACRAVARALRKLRAAVVEDTSWRI
jgi:DNA-directed RNA polymerase specialized sigma24 family protein